MRILLLPVGTLTVAGNLYRKEVLEPHFQPGSQFLERIQTGSMFGEVSTPKPEKHETVKMFAARVSEIRHDRICLQIIDATLEDDGIYGTIKPFGPYGHMVQEMIDRGQVPMVAMRSFTLTLKEKGIFEVKHIVTFDLIPPT